MSKSNELKTLTKQAILRFQPDRPVSPELVADNVMKEIDPNRDAPPLVGWSSTLQLRQIARGLLHNTYEKNDDQGDLFGDELPDKMPGFGDHEGFYIPRDMMTPADYEGNIARYEKELAAKQSRLDKLRAEYEEKKAAGAFASAA